MAIAHVNQSTFTTAGGSTSYDFPFPTSPAPAADDLILLALSNNVADDPSNTPSGWSVAFKLSPTGQGRNLAVYYKISSGSEGATQTVTWPIACAPQGGMLTKSGVDLTTPLDVTSLSEEQLGGSSHAAPSLTPVTNDTVIVHLWTAGTQGATWGTVADVDERFEIASSANARPLLVVDRVGPASGVASGTATSVASVALNALVGSVALRAAAGGPPPDPGITDQLMVGVARW